jgi:hypothetical protein
LYGVIFSLGIVPTVLMIAWTRFFTERWFSDHANHESPGTLRTALGLGSNVGKENES